MGIYPRNLKSNWYTAEVCDYIYHSLEGAKNWIAPSYQAKCEREAFIETFSACQELVQKQDMKPEAMLEQLEMMRLGVNARPKEPFFTKARWLYNPTEARAAAVEYATDLVKGISERFLP